MKPIKVEPETRAHVCFYKTPLFSILPRTTARGKPSLWGRFPGTVDEAVRRRDRPAALSPDSCRAVLGACPPDSENEQTLHGSPQGPGLWVRPWQPCATAAVTHSVQTRGGVLGVGYQSRGAAGPEKRDRTGTPVCLGDTLFLLDLRSPNEAASISWPAPLASAAALPGGSHSGVLPT